MTSTHRIVSGALVLGALLATSPSSAQDAPAAPPPSAPPAATSPPPPVEETPAEPGPAVAEEPPAAEEPAAPEQPLGSDPAAEPVQAEVMPWAPPAAQSGEAPADAAVEEPEGPYVPHWMWFDIGFRTGSHCPYSAGMGALRPKVKIHVKKAPPALGGAKLFGLLRLVLLYRCLDFRDVFVGRHLARFIQLFGCLHQTYDESRF